MICSDFACVHWLQNELVEAYEDVKKCFQRLDADENRSATAFAAEMDQLCRRTERFLDLNTFLQSGEDPAGGSSVSTNNAVLCMKLFGKLTAAALDRWHQMPAAVLEVTPNLIQLYASARNLNDASASQQIAQLGKLLFMLSKDSANDGAFCSVRYVEAALDAISSTSVSAQTTRQSSLKRSADDDSDQRTELDQAQLLFPMKTLIYIAGTLKNVSNGDDKMLKLLATHRAIPILSETLLWRAEDSGMSKEIAQFLVQATGVLRNLSATKSNSKQFIEARMAARLCAVIPSFASHQELIVNVSRILSKLTLHERPRAQINERPENIEHLVAIVDHTKNPWLSLAEQQPTDNRFQDLLFVRIFFVLGNLCAGNDRNRNFVALDCDGIRVFLKVLQVYTTRYVGQQQHEADSNSEGTPSGDQTIDILVKLVRVLANVAMNAETAVDLNARDELSLLPELLQHSFDAGDEELMLNTVSLITNLSYYYGASDAQAGEGCVESHRISIAAALAQILLIPNEEAVLEAARTFGNLSRHKDVLSYMRDHKVLDCFVLLLDHCSREIVYTVCGVLMNAALDRATRQALMTVQLPATSVPDNDGPVDVQTILVDIIASAAEDDTDMALIASKVLYNLLLDQSAATNGKTRRSTDKLRRILSDAMENVEEPRARRRAKQVRREDEEGDNDAEPSEESDAISRQELTAVLAQLQKRVSSV